MLSCKQAGDLFSPYSDDELESDQSQILEQHLKDCAPCQQRFAEFEAALEALRALPRLAAPRGLRAAVLDRVEAEAVGSAAVGAQQSFGWLQGAALLLFGLVIFAAYSEFRLQSPQASKDSALMMAAMADWQERWDFLQQQIAGGAQQPDAQQLSAQQAQLQQHQVDLRLQADHLSTALNRLRTVTTRTSKDRERFQESLRVQLDRLRSKVDSFQTQIQQHQSQLAIFESIEKRLKERDHNLESNRELFTTELSSLRKDFEQLGDWVKRSHLSVANSERKPPQLLPKVRILANNGGWSVSFNSNDPAAIDELFVRYDQSRGELRRVLVDHLDQYFEELLPLPKSDGGQRMGIKRWIPREKNSAKQDDAERIETYRVYWQSQQGTQSEQNY